MQLSKQCYYFVPPLFPVSLLQLCKKQPDCKTPFLTKVNSNKVCICLLLTEWQTHQTTIELLRLTVQCPTLSSESSQSRHYISWADRAVLPGSLCCLLDTLSDSQTQCMEWWNHYWKLCGASALRNTCYNCSVNFTITDVNILLMSIRSRLVVITKLVTNNAGNMFYLLCLHSTKILTVT